MTDRLAFGDLELHINVPYSFNACISLSKESRVHTRTDIFIYANYIDPVNI